MRLFASIYSFRSQKEILISNVRTGLKIIEDISAQEWAPIIDFYYFCEVAFLAAAAVFFAKS